ncbi:2-hydroxy-3-oxopropionate reductase [bacterium HR08]|nr:2-hydroxy-3-oxopropionate reductase [bacterium HR08]
MRLGFIGLGTMGRPMAMNLLRAGFPLTVYNRTASKAQPLLEMGAAWAPSPADLAEASEVVLTMLSDTPDVEAVLFGPGGVWEGIRPGSIVIEMSTIAPEAAAAFARRLAERGCEMLDAPVSGGERGAIEGTLAIMVGGREDTFQRCLPILRALGKTIIYTGPSGNGQKTKLVNQLICALTIIAVIEGVHLAESLGLNLETTFRVVSGGAAASWMLSTLAPKIIQNDFAPGFKIALQQKDLRLVREAIQQISGRALENEPELFPGAALAFRLFHEAVAEGLGEQGTQGLIALYRRRARL